jgi:hypothetical protein
MIANDHESLVFILRMPFLQGRHHILAVDTAKGPHLNDDNLAAQVRESQRRIYIQPDIVCQFGRHTEIGEGSRI